MLVGYDAKLPLVMDIQERWLGGDDIPWATVVGDLAVRIGGLPTESAHRHCSGRHACGRGGLTTPRYREQADHICPPLPLRPDGVISHVRRVRASVQGHVLKASCRRAHRAMLVCDYRFATLPACIVTFTGLSQFANGIVAIWNLHRGSAAYTYSSMISPQWPYTFPIRPAKARSPCQWGGPDPWGCLYSLAGIVAGSIVRTMLGIVFR